MTSTPAAARRLGAALRAAGSKRARVAWPAPAWRGRIIEFARDVLGVRSLDEHQVEILEAWAGDDSASILVCTGQKMGKTECEIVAAGFEFATERDVRVWLYAPKIDHTEAVFWPRFAKAIIEAFYPCTKCMPAHRAWCALVEVDPFDETPRPGRCPDCSPLIPSELKDPERPEKGRVSDWLNPTDAEAGLRSPDGRSVRAYTGRKEGSKGGFSGKLRLLADECSDITDGDRETWAGNLVGGGKVMGFGNLLRPLGWFARAFRPGSKEASRWRKRVQKSSRFSPNCRGRIEWSDGAITENGRWLLFPGGVAKRPAGLDDHPRAAQGRPIRGMATPEKIEENLRAWAGTNYICARIDARPPEVVEGQLAASSTVAGAEGRWTPEDDQSGVLQFGVDVGRVRDPLAIAERRGRKIREVYAEVLGEDDHARGVEILMGKVRAARRPNERKPRVVYDATGKEGHDFGKELRHYVATSKDPLDDVEIIAIQMGHPPVGNRNLFDKRRDQLAIKFATWLKTGAVPPDGELEAEIEATTSERVEVSYGASGQKWEVLRVVDNDTLRKTLGRSPNKRNACELAVLDVDGDDAKADEVGEPQESPPAMVAEPSAVAPEPAPARPRRPAPRLNEEPAGPRSLFERQDELYGSLWGES